MYNNDLALSTNSYSWHQSHDQATVLLLVPPTTTEADIHVEIEHSGNYIVAGLHGQPPILKGRLYAPVDANGSLWQLEPLSRSRLSARERTTSTTSTASSHSGSSFALISGSEHEFSSNFTASLETSDAEDASPFDSRSPIQTSRSVSPGHALQSLATASFSSLESLRNRSGRLLTLHLDKQSAGMWSSLIIAAAPESFSPSIADSVVYNCSDELEHRYNLDPTSLTLIGVEMLDIRREQPQAFEYFIRAWHQAHTQTATMKLVTHYVPLQATVDLPETEKSAVQGTTPYYVQCLGGESGLAQLYLEAGLLHLEGAASGLLASSASSLASLRLPIPMQGDINSTEAWKRDREAAAHYFERARTLNPSLDIPVVPPHGSRDPSDHLEMPSIDIFYNEKRNSKDVPDTSVFGNRDAGLSGEYNACEEERSLYVQPLREVDASEQARYLPQLIKGDLDSLRPDVRDFYAAQDVPIVCDSDQYSTDLMKCVAAIEEMEAKESKRYDIVLLGGLSGRLDQTIHTLSYLFKLRKKRERVFAVTDDNVGWLLDAGEHEIIIDHTVLGPTCGLLPVGIDSTILSTRGLKWNLTNHESSFDGLVSTSNHLVPDEPAVWIRTSRPIWWTAELRAITSP
ncbi:TPK-B1-binding domain-containing protein [Mycena chlorophos]|uniref:TPK-B1-binding domain-containing protein n=1 Tax=Mycena chlorophos TaxID=658473 RepID=A0A8H6WLK4_MYCCL|nr:TPK-B1-binding domain-containing protein [Mycena chlorophos]